MRADKAFIDTNVFIYYQRSDDITKHNISEAVVNAFDCVISTQVLNEICNILTHKFPTPLSEINKYLLDIITSSYMVIISYPLVQQALKLHEKYSISYYDSLIVAAALEANCKYLISEDM